MRNASIQGVKEGRLRCARRAGCKECKEERATKKFCTRRGCVEVKHNYKACKEKGKIGECKRARSASKEEGVPEESASWLREHGKCTEKVQERKRRNEGTRRRAQWGESTK
jgi:hypothetical protein